MNAIELYVIGLPLLFVGIGLAAWVAARHMAHADRHHRAGPAE